MPTPTRYLLVLFVVGAAACSEKAAPPPPDKCAAVFCAALDACHVAGTCAAATGVCSNPAAPDGTLCTGGACTGGVCVPATDKCAGVVCTARDTCHVAGVCAAATGVCSDPTAPDGTLCTGGACAAGVCVPATDKCAGVVCTAQDACHVAGVCAAATGVCSNPTATDGTPCTGGACAAGVCAPISTLCAGVTCPALDACHPAGLCDPETGACVHAAAAEGAACTGGVCTAGVCVAAGGTCTDGVRNASETDVDCGGALCPLCVDSKQCGSGGDCLSGSCVSGRCARPVTALVADPGPQRSVAGGALVTLDGSRSRAPAGNLKSFSWAQTEGPAVSLTGADTAWPHFVAPAAGEAGNALAFTLTVGDGAATASATVRVMVRATNRPAETTGLGLILEALDEGRLDRDTGIAYLAYSAFGDPRLPAEFAGTEGSPSASATLHIIAKEFPSLSPAAQALVAPFLLPPAVPGSWASPSAAQQGLRLQAPVTSGGWEGVSSAHLVIWFKPTLANGRKTAAALSAEAEGVIWPKLRGVFTPAHQPVLDDAGIKLVNGGTHGKLNVYLVPALADGANGVEIPYHQSPSPSYIMLKQSLPFRGKPMGLTEALAHELTHSYQDSYEQMEDYQGHRWIFEGIATWAQDFVYTTNTEHPYAPYLLNQPWLPLDDEWSLHPYGAYLFFQYISRAGSDDDFVRRVFDYFEDFPGLEALDRALSPYDGLKFAWRGFSEALWNRDPTMNFWGVDGLEKGARENGSAAVEARMVGPETQWEMSPTVKHLSTQYVHFTFPDKTARMIYFYDGLTFPLELKTVEGSQMVMVKKDWEPDKDVLQHLSVEVLLKRGDAWDKKIPVLGALFACQDDPAQKVDEIAIAFAYGRPLATDWVSPKGLPARLYISNIACNRWQGTVNGQTSPGEGPLEETTATVTWVPDAMGVTAGLPMFSPSAGSYTWKVSGDYEGCSYSGSDSWSGGGYLNGTLTFLPQFIDGPAHRGYGGSGGNHEVTYQESCPDGNGGTTTTTHKKYVSWFDTERAADRSWFPQVAADGLKAADTADNGEMVYTWSFTATVP